MRARGYSERRGLCTMKATGHDRRRVTRTIGPGRGWCHRWRPDRRCDVRRAEISRRRAERDVGARRARGSAVLRDRDQRQRRFQRPRSPPTPNEPNEDRDDDDQRDRRARCHYDCAVFLHPGPNLGELDGSEDHAAAQCATSSRAYSWITRVEPRGATRTTPRVLMRKLDRATRVARCGGALG